MKKHYRTPGLLFLGALLSGPVLVNAEAADLATLKAPCEDCHGRDGASTESKIPTIGGLSPTYITDSIAAYADKDRPCEAVKYPAGAKKGETANMCDIAGKLSNDKTKLLADHYAGKPFVRAKQAFNADLAKRGKVIHELECEKCHEDGGTSADDDAGMLGGQWTPYLEEQFEEFGEGKRPMPEKMQPKFKKLTANDIKELLQYYASIQ